MRTRTRLPQFGADATREDRWGISPLKEAQRLASRVGSTPIYDYVSVDGWGVVVMIRLRVDDRRGAPPLPPTPTVCRSDAAQGP
jgi:hypothetical protein